MGNLALNLQEKREQAGFSIERVAFELGVEEKTLTLWEKGKAEPTPDQALALAGLYRCRLEDLVEGKPMKEKKEKGAAGRYAVLVTAAYLVLGAVCGLWHPGWMLFLCIPLYNLPQDVRYSWRILGNPVMVTLLYLALGFCFGLWHPGWLMFLLIPAVPALSKSIRRDETKDQ